MSFCTLLESLETGSLKAKDKQIFTNFAKCHGKEVHQKTVRGHTGCVNALGISQDDLFLSSAGDDRRTFLWNIQDILLDEKPRPIRIMDQLHFANVFSTHFVPGGKHLISTGNDALTIVHDIETGKSVQRYSLYRNHIVPNFGVYNSSPMPECGNVFVACSENPFINVYDIRIPHKEVAAWPITKENYSVDFNPQGRMIAIAGKRQLAIFDARTGTDIYEGKLKHWLKPRRGATHAKWSPSGHGIAVVRSCTVPIFLDFIDSTVTYLTDKRRQYSTWNTVKSCEFIDDDTIATGSENFEIFMWRFSNSESCEIDELPEPLSTFEEKHDIFDMKQSEVYTKLQGHRSIPNMMKYSRKYGALFSSGVEKIIKTWTIYPFPHSTTKPELRRPFTFRIPFDDDDIYMRGDRSDESEDEEVLYHFDQLREDHVPSPSINNATHTDSNDDNEEDNDVEPHFYHVADSSSDSDPSDMETMLVLGSEVSDSEDEENNDDGSSNSSEIDEIRVAIPLPWILNPEDDPNDDDSD